MNKEILRLAVPSILSNIIVPLLGLIDLSIAGHIGTAAFIGAVSVGATMFSLTYWNFGFLRMGTSGITAQAFGADNKPLMATTLCRAVVLALVLGVALIALQAPLCRLFLWVIAPSQEVEAMAAQYFHIIIWGAPAMLATMGLTGWFIGMQNTRIPFVVAMAVNVINIGASLSLVFAAGMGFVGIPLGTLIAQWCGFLLSTICALRLARKSGISISISINQLADGIGRFFRINSDIFLRSLCMMAVMLWFTSVGAREGNMTLAVNALFMQLYMLYANFMDGFAYAAEALVGKFCGAADRESMRRCSRALFRWGWAIAAVFALCYGGFNEPVMRLFSDDAAVIASASHYSLWMCVVPVAGVGAFLWDGVFIGLTATRHMLLSLIGGAAVFFAFALNPSLLPDHNHTLWLAYTLFLTVRGFILWLIFRRRQR